MYRGLAKAKHGLDQVFEFKRLRNFGSWADFAAGTFGGKALPVDWKRTRVATVGAYECAFLFVNLRDRGPAGIVDRDQYQPIVTDLVERFSNLTHPVTGRKLYRQVSRGVDIYPRSTPDILLPDVILLPEEGYGLSSRISSMLPEGTSEGVHRHNGVLFMKGEKLRSSVPGLSPYLIDLAPTILHALGLPVPADMDGRVLEELFSEPEAIRYEHVDNCVTQAPALYDGVEAQMIEQRLRALGYVE